MMINNSGTRSDSQFNQSTNHNQTQTNGSRTITITSSDSENQTNHSTQSSVLILRAHPSINHSNQVRQTRVQWSENVIDNEGLGRKKSKVCCIYKKPRAFDESSDESDHHSDSDCCQHSPNPQSQSIQINHSTEQHKPTPSTSLNAYEVEPINSKGKGKA